MERIELLNNAAYAVAILKRSSRKLSSQVNQLLEVLSQGEGHDAILLVMEHLIYQTGRRDLLPRDFCKHTFDMLLEIKNKIEDSLSAETTAREFLLHIKRLYKGAEEHSIEGVTSVENAFEKLATQVLTASNSSRHGQSGRGGRDRSRRR